MNETNRTFYKIPVYIIRIDEGNMQINPFDTIIVTGTVIYPGGYMDVYSRHALEMIEELLDITDAQRMIKELSDNVYVEKVLEQLIDTTYIEKCVEEEGYILAIKKSDIIFQNQITKEEVDKNSVSEMMSQPFYVLKEEEENIRREKDRSTISKIKQGLLSIIGSFISKVSNPEKRIR